MNKKECPDCGKTLKTDFGFRMHQVKQHGKKLKLRRTR
jgi:hypothetical protein